MSKMEHRKKNHAPKTKENMSVVTNRWTRFCQFLAEKEDIMTFLDWPVDTFPKIRKRSTMLEYKRVFFMIYRKSMNCDFDREAASEIHDYIMSHLTISYALDTTTNDKPVLNVDDVYLILHHHWVHNRSRFPDEHQRVQLALMLQIPCYTATRPRVLAYAPINKKRIAAHYIGQNREVDLHAEWNPEEDDFRPVSYRDIKLFLLPNPGAPKYLLVMEITLRYTKGWNQRPIPKTFILYEVDDLIFDATVLMVALAILHQAFKAEVSSVEDIYKIRVMPPRHSLEFDWKEDFLNIPVFRQPESNSGNGGTSPTQPIRYHTYLGYLQRLGVLSGFMQILTCYMIRRGLGEAVEGLNPHFPIGTQGQLQQVMSHRNASIYQAYINQKKVLISAATHMSRYVDTRAPTRAGQQRIGLIELRDMLYREVCLESGNVRQAKKDVTELYRMYANIAAKVTSMNVLIRKVARKNTRRKLFEEINTVEINKQIRNEHSAYLDALNDTLGQQPSHQLEERKMLAELICADTESLDEEIKLQHRLCTANTLVRLGRTREPPRPRLPRTVPQVQKRYVRNQCFFCYWEHGDSTTFCTIYKARNHMKLHLRRYDEYSLICCPESNSIRSNTYVGIESFQSHLAKEHFYDIFKERAHFK
ncbi:putative FluG domain containing protein [Rhypophila decipiens]